MSCFWRHIGETGLQIPSVRDVDNVTFYLITVKVDEVVWSVSRRYSEFYELHQTLCNDHGVSKNLLPPKRTIRNKCPNFIETRRQALECYLQNIFNYLKRTMPKEFVEFLEFNIYDTFYLLKKLAFRFCTEGDSIVNKEVATFNPLELYSISICLKQPFPNVVETDKRYEFSHVLDYCTQVTNLSINGIPKKFLLSNIEANKLPIDLSIFKSLKSLSINFMPLNNVSSLGTLRNTVEKLSVAKSSITNISDILQCDVLHKTQLCNSQIWINLELLDLRFNNITEIGPVLSLVPNLKRLYLGHNKITKLGDVSSLTKLTHLYVNDNSISNCEDLHLKLGNIVVLDLSQNLISSLEGFKKLYSLEKLKLSSNQITDINQIVNVGNLPCLEYLSLTGNVVATVVDYRAKVFECFGPRAKEICLDNEKPTQSELDKAAIFQALTIVREGRTPRF